MLASLGNISSISFYTDLFIYMYASFVEALENVANVVKLKSGVHNEMTKD